MDIKKAIKELQRLVYTISIEDTKKVLERLKNDTAGESDEKQYDRLFLLEALLTISEQLRKAYYEQITIFPNPGKTEQNITALIYKSVLINQFIIETSEQGSPDLKTAVGQFNYSVGSYIRWLEEEAPEAAHLSYQFDFIPESLQ